MFAESKHKIEETMKTQSHSRMPSKSSKNQPTNYTRTDGRSPQRINDFQIFQKLLKLKVTCNSPKFRR